MSKLAIDAETAIIEVINTQFAALHWQDSKEADWASFFNGFMPDALLYPAARPATAITIQTFSKRMRQLAEDGVLSCFEELPLGIKILQFGNVAVALAGCEMLENNHTVTRDVSAFLLIRSEECWRIAAQAWDAETELNPLPEEIQFPIRPIEP